MSESSKQQQQQQQAPNDTNLPYWNQKWQANKIGFHRSAASVLIKANLLSKLVSLDQQQCVVFPLCGKSLDMKAVLDVGHRVIGIEGSEIGVEAFFKENNITYEIEHDEGNKCKIYKSTDRPLTIYCADFFNFNRALPPVDWIWDRGGLVAINPVNQEEYRDSLLRMMTPGRTRLYLVAIHYDDPNFSAPPHIVSDDDVKQLFGSECSIEFVQAHDETADYNARDTLRHARFIEERLHLIVKEQK